ncbi:MAG: transcription antitermination factor NusB [Gemmatimonadales bacterium]
MTEAPRGDFDGPRDRAERIDRSRARAWLLQVHYRWESEGGKGSFQEALRNVIATRRVSPKRLPYVRRVVDVLDGRLTAIDAALREALDNWRLERLSAIDRAVLRIGAAELLFVADVPAKVAIQEAIHLAEAYGGDESPRFVNGVLDALYKRHDRHSEERNARP